MKAGKHSGKWEKIPPSKMQAMFEDYMAGMSQVKIAEKYDTTPQTVIAVKKKQEWDKKMFRAEDNLIAYEKALHATLITQFLEKMREDTVKIDQLIARAFSKILEDEHYEWQTKDIDLLMKLKLLVINTISDNLSGPKLPPTNNITINNNTSMPEIDSKLTSEERTNLYKIFNEARKKDKPTEDFVAEFQKNFPLDESNKALKYGSEGECP